VGNTKIRIIFSIFTKRNKITHNICATTITVDYMISFAAYIYAMLHLGKTNTLTALRQTDNGIYLVDEESNEVLLPNKYIPENFELGHKLEVFLYKDSEDREIATTLKPYLKLNEYAALKAVAVSNVGAFFDWGLEKDLLVPISQQAEPIDEEDYYVVYMYLDEKSNRLAGTTKINNTLNRDSIELKIGDEVELIPYEETDIGISVIVNNSYQGMLFNNEVFTDIKVGDHLKGFVKKIRSDNKIDVSLNSFGYSGIDANIKKLFQALEQNDGSINLNDKSSPEDISEKLGMSKKVFKKALGALYKQRRIEITEEGIKFIDNEKK